MPEKLIAQIHFRIGDPKVIQSNSMEGFVLKFLLFLFYNDELNYHNKENIVKAFIFNNDYMFAMNIFAEILDEIYWGEFHFTVFNNDQKIFDSNESDFENNKKYDLQFKEKIKNESDLYLEFQKIEQLIEIQDIIS